MIEARLRIEGVNGVYLDKYLQGGDEWHRSLREKATQSKYFICLIGKTTLSDSNSFVRKEIEWVRDLDNCTIIPIWQYGVDMQADCPDDFSFLREKHSHIMKGHTAQDYEIAVNFILNALGYSTY